MVWSTEELARQSLLDHYCPHLNWTPLLVALQSKFCLNNPTVAIQAVHAQLHLHVSDLTFGTPRSFSAFASEMLFPNVSTRFVSKLSTRFLELLRSENDDFGLFTVVMCGIRQFQQF